MVFRQQKLQQKKSLSQVFLNEDWPCKKTSQILLNYGVKEVLEIGPGGGILTRSLLDAGFNVHAIEKDERFGEQLNTWKKENEKQKLTVTIADILNFDLHSWVEQKAKSGPIAICGNIPYHISSAILHLILPELDNVKACVLMVQKEFAERLAARENQKAFGSLSIFTQLRASVRLEFIVPKTTFKPMPKVDSAVVSIEPAKVQYAEDVLKKVELISRQAFSQRRKKISNSLAPFLKDPKIWDIPLDANRRCETLTVQEFVALAEFFLHDK